MKKLLSAVLLSLTVSLPMMAANENLKLSYNKPATVYGVKNADGAYTALYIAK